MQYSTVAPPRFAVVKEADERCTARDTVQFLRAFQTSHATGERAGQVYCRIPDLRRDAGSCKAWISGDVSR